MKKALIVFTKVPVAGFTKTRLQKNLKKEQCAGFHRAMLLDLNENIKGIDADLFIAYTPKGKCNLLDDIFTGDYTFFEQCGEDIWEKMKYCIKKVLAQGYEKAILIGTDIPEINSRILEESFSRIRKNRVVITPTMDDGYCLIGVDSNITDDVFGKVFDIKGRDNLSVADETIKQIEDCGYEAVVNDRLIDIDYLEDIYEFAEKTDLSGYKNISEFLNSNRILEVS